MPQRRPSHQSIVYAASDVSVSVDNSADSAAQTTPIFSGYDNCSPVHVNLKISREHTLDGEGREVEFMFHPSNDDFQVVAKEMIEELALTLPVNNLAEIIHIEVTEAQRSVIAAYAALGEERKSHGASQLESLLPNDFNQPATLQMTFDCVERSVCVDQKVEDVSTMQNSFTSAAINDDIHPRDTSTPAETEIVEITVVPATDCVPSANQTRTSVETAVIKELVQHDSTQNDDSDDDLGLMDEEDEHLKQEIVRIDKEAGHARRVFEQRIQKHKSIQAIFNQYNFTVRLCLMF